MSAYYTPRAAQATPRDNLCNPTRRDSVRAARNVLQRAQINSMRCAPTRHGVSLSQASVPTSTCGEECGQDMLRCCQGRGWGGEGSAARKERPARLVTLRLTHG